MTPFLQQQTHDEALFHLPNWQVRKKSCSLVSASWFLVTLAPSMVPPALCDLEVQCCFPRPGISLSSLSSSKGSIGVPCFSLLWPVSLFLCDARPVHRLTTSGCGPTCKSGLPGQTGDAVLLCTDVCAARQVDLPA